MKSTLALAAILGLALVSAPATVNAQTPAPATTAPAAKAKATKTQYSGTLSAVDTTANTITVTDKTVAAKTIAIAATTKIKKDSKPATLADFKVGDKVTGSFTTDASGAMTAASLNEKTSAKKTAKATATTAAPATTPATATH